MKSDLPIPVIIGRIGSVYGIHGWLKVFSYTEPRENIFYYHPWQLQIANGWQEIKINATRIQGNDLLVQFAECDVREKARFYTNANIGIQREQLPTLKKNEFYWVDLQGLQVVTINNISLGIVDHLIETGANDVLVVKGKDKLRLIPYLPKQVIKDIDLAKKLITVDWDPVF